MRQAFETASDILGAGLLIIVILGLVIGVPALRDEYGDTVITSSGRHVATDSYQIALLIVGAALFIGLVSKSKPAVLIVCGLIGLFLWYVSTQM